MEHLLNCHGEWTALLGFLSVLPLIGPWVRARLHEHVDSTKE